MQARTIITDYDGVDNRARGPAIQLDGRIVAAGFAFNQGFLLQGDGRIVALGFSNYPKKFAVGRFLP